MHTDSGPTARFVEALLSVDRQKARRVFELQQAHASPMEVVDDLVMPALEGIGDGWARGETSLSQIYMASRICEGLVEERLPAVGGRRDEPPRLAVAVLGDGHGLGRQLVLLSLRSGGYRPLDLGSQRTVAELLAACVEHDVDVLFVSVLMLRSALEVAALKTALSEAGRRTRLVVGGAPFRFDAELWREVGADRFGYGAADALRIMTELGGAS